MDVLTAITSMYTAVPSHRLSEPVYQSTIYATHCTVFNSPPHAIYISPPPIFLPVLAPIQPYQNGTGETCPSDKRAGL